MLLEREVADRIVAKSRLAQNYLLACLSRLLWQREVQDIRDPSGMNLSTARPSIAATYQ
jgi:hypothetical protein